MLIVNTNSLKHLPLKDALSFICDLGVKGIELTTDGRAHAYSYIVGEKPVDELEDLLKQSGLCCRILSGGWADFLTGETNLVKKQEYLAKKIGAEKIRFFISNPHIEVKSTVCNFYKVVQNCISSYPLEDVSFLFENHGGMFANTFFIEMFFQKFSRSHKIGMVYDPANFIYDNVDALDALDTLHPYIKHVHVKDINLDKKFVTIGDGVVPWSTIIDRLNKFGYSGDYSIEFEGHQYSGMEKEQGLIESIKRLGDILK